MTKSYLVKTPSESGKLAEADADFRALISDLERARGIDHPTTSIMRYHHALCLKQEKKFTEAEKQARLAYDSAAKTLGPQHPTTLLVKKFLTQLENSKF